MLKAETCKKLLVTFATHYWLFVILTVGVTIRFYALDHVPPSLHADEAYYAYDGMYLLKNHHFNAPILQNQDKFGLFTCLLAASFYLLGDSLWTIRATMAVFGCLTLIGCYLLARIIWHSHKDARLISQISTFFLATSLWHIHFSRVAFSASLTPFFETYSLLLTLLALRNRRSIYFLVAGVVTGLGLYTYWQFYSFSLLPLYLMYEHGKSEQSGKQSRLFFLVVGASMLPLVYIGWHTDLFDRIRWLFIANGLPAAPLQTQVLTFLNHVMRNSALTVGMLFFVGDADWKHNFNSNPELPLIAAIGLLVALAATVRLWRNAMAYKTLQAWDGHYIAIKEGSVEWQGMKNSSRRLRSFGIMTAWLFLAMVPGVLSDGYVPHASRTMNMAVPALILSGYGLNMLKDLFSHCVMKNDYSSFNKTVLCSYIALAAIWQIYTVSYNYFFLWANDPRTKEAFHSDLGWCEPYLFCRQGQ